MALRMCLSLVNRQALECNSKVLFGLLIPDQPACIEAANINLNSNPVQSSGWERFVPPNHDGFGRKFYQL